jgi:PAS domain S-box-containing protein
MERARVLIAEDEAIIAMDLAAELEKLGHSVTAIVASGDEALRSVMHDPPDLVLMDITLKGQMTGIETAQRLKETTDIPVIYLTSHADTATIRQATLTGPIGYVLKPFNERELHATIQVGLYRYRAEIKSRKLERWLTAALDSMTDAVITLDKDGRVTLMNPQAEQLTGRLKVDALGQPFSDVLQVVSIESRRPVEHVIENARVQGLSVELEEHICIHARDKSEVPIDFSVAPLRDNSGAVTGAAIVFRDCTARKRTEETITALRQQLKSCGEARESENEAARREKEAFLHSVSHDLKAPLRAVNSYGEILAEQYGDTLNDEAKSFLSVIRTNSNRLAEMIEDFIRLSRWQDQAPRLTHVNMKDVVEAVLAELSTQHGKPLSMVRVNPMPDTIGDEGLIRQVWINLIANAIKFTSRKSDPYIEIGGSTGDGQTSYYVKDNGAGFNMAYAHKLFSIFQRLHRSDEFEGTGIGLAIVGRIIQNHGGEVTAIGEIDVGAEFRFTLPMAPRNQRDV